MARDIGNDLAFAPQIVRLARRATEAPHSFVGAADAFSRHANPAAHHRRNIDKIYFDALSDYQVGETVVARLLEIGRVRRPFRVEEVLRKDSLELTDGDREVIRQRVAGAPEAHILITHGTDTMTETAKALADIPGKTIVLVGALAPARFGESDASFNLGMAFAAVQLAEPGVYIAMSGSVFRADRVVKDRAAGMFVASES